MATSINLGNRIPSQKCIDFIKEFEGLYLNAYHDPTDREGIITIGYGSIMYQDGTKPKLGDTITQAQADELLLWEVNNKAKAVDYAIGRYPCTQSQFDSFVSFTYNLGIDALVGSTLLKKFKVNPADQSIYKYSVDKDSFPVPRSCEFLKWIMSNGRVVNGLIRRRAGEADMYAGK